MSYSRHKEVSSLPGCFLALGASLVGVSFSFLPTAGIYFWIFMLLTHGGQRSLLGRFLSPRSCREMRRWGGLLLKFILQCHRHTSSGLYPCWETGPVLCGLQMSKWRPKLLLGEHIPEAASSAAPSGLHGPLMPLMVSHVCLWPFPVGFSVFSLHQLNSRGKSHGLTSSRGEHSCADSAARSCWPGTAGRGWLLTLILHSSGGCDFAVLLSGLHGSVSFCSDQASCELTRLVACLSLAELSPWILWHVFGSAVPSQMCYG